MRGSIHLACRSVVMDAKKQMRSLQPGIGVNSYPVVWRDRLWLDTPRVEIAQATATSAGQKRHPNARRYQYGEILRNRG
jgi:hypothetical protein